MPLQPRTEDEPIHSLISDNQQSRVIILASIFCLVCSLLHLATRLWIRWPLRSLFGRDDTAAVFATIVATAQSGTVIAAVCNGLGCEADDPSADWIVEKMIYASNLVYVAALCLGKLAMTLLFERLSDGAPEHDYMHKAITGVAAMWGVAGVLTIALAGDVPSPWMALLDFSTFQRWLAIEVLGVVIELVIFAAAIRLLWGLHISMGSKLKIVLGFGLRLPIIAVVAFRLISLHDRIGNADIAMAYTLPEILTQLEMHYIIIAATLPCLRIFLKSFHTGELGGVEPDWRENDSVTGKSIGRVRLWSLDNNVSRGSGAKERNSSSASGPVEIPMLDRL